LIRLFTILGFLCIICGWHYPVSGQDLKRIKQSEDTLLSILTIINQTRDDSLRGKLNASFYNILHEALMLPGVDHYPFHSLKTLVKISSPDDKFTIYHWNLPGNQGKHAYFGFIKMLNREPAVVYPLKDMADSILLPETAYLDQYHWFGALYYKIIPCLSSQGQPFYTLLGWSGKDGLVTRKIIEVLTFDEQGVPGFGLPVFPDYGDGKTTRVIYRFSASTSISLKYEDQTIEYDKKWNPRKRNFEYKTKMAKMIVCDRIVPLDPNLEGQYQFYVAAGDVFDGFEFKNGNWIFLQGIDSRNKK